MGARILIACALACGFGTSLLAQTAAVTVPVTVLHSFASQPSERPFRPRSITPASDGSAFLVSVHYSTPSASRITRIGPRGAATTIYEAASADVRDRIVPGGDGAYYALNPPRHDSSGGVLRIHLDGSVEVVYEHPAGVGSPRAIRRAPDGTLYVSSWSSVDNTDRVTLIHGDGTVHHNAFTLPGPVLAIARDGAVYGITNSQCVSCPPPQLFRRTADGTVTNLATVPERYVLPPDMTFTASGLLVGVTTDIDFNCVVFAFDVSVRVLRSVPDNECWLPRLQADPATGGVVGLIGSQLFRVNARGEYSVVREFGREQGAFVDVAPMPNGALWVAGEAAGEYSRCSPFGSAVYELGAPDRWRPIVSFTAGESNGLAVSGTLALAGDGFVYGTTWGGGPWNAGTIFRVARTGGSYQRLYSFTCAGDGGGPMGLVRTQDGALFGATWGGADHRGTIFRVGPSGNFTTVFVFRRVEHGEHPYGLVVDRTGQLYGWTISGGQFGEGTIFRVSAEGVLAVLHNFRTADGVPRELVRQIVVASDGALYWTTYKTLYKMAPRGDVSALWRVSGLEYLDFDSNLVEGPDGRIYGTVRGGAFAITKEGVVTRFEAGEFASLRPQVLGADGFIYGTHRPVGSDRSGKMFRMTSSGHITQLQLSGAPSIEIASWRLHLQDGADGYLYGYTTPIEFAPYPMQLFRLARPGPGAPRNLRIVPSSY